MKSKYFYDGEPLIEYCKKHEIKYNHLTKYISVKLKQDSSRNPEELIKEFITKKHKKYNNYLINGMSLYKYCEAMNISYYSVAKAISRAKKDPKYKEIDEDEITNIVLDKYLMNSDVKEFIFEEPKKLVLKPRNKKD